MYDFLRINKESFASLTGKISYIHKDTGESGTAYCIGEKIEISILLPIALGTSRADIVIYDIKSGERKYEQSLLRTRRDGALEEYRANFKNNVLGRGIYGVLVEIDSFVRLYSYDFKGDLGFSDEIELSRLHRLSVSDFLYNEPRRIYGGVIYHIFVDRFSRGEKNKSRDGSIIYDLWDSSLIEYPEYPGAHLKNNTFFGGDLKGIIKKLPYICSLGVTCLYLSPIFLSPSNHRYDTSDYMQVDSLLGGNSALGELVSECKKIGIGIILDGVFNHTGSDSLYFNKNGKFESIGAYQSISSPYYSWYNFRKWPDSYECWWDIDILPRLDHTNRNVKEFFVGKEGVVRHYAKLGVDGFRLDVADELSDEFISEIREVLEENTDSPILYGEVWEDASCKWAYDELKEYYLGCELDGVMNYPLRNGLISYIKYKNTEELRYALEVLNNMPKRIRDAAMNLLGSHDTARIITVLGENYDPNRKNCDLAKARMSSDEYNKARELLKSAYTVISTLPGVPSVYYGDEVGLEGYNDPFNRNVFPWGSEDSELLSHYKTIGKIRRENPVYKDGSLRILLLDTDAFIFLRTQGREVYITAYNNSEKELVLKFASKVRDLLTGVFQTLYVLKPKTAAIYKSKNRKNTIIINPDER